MLFLKDEIGFHCAFLSPYAQGMRVSLILALAYPVFVLPLAADQLTQQMTARLADEADAFQRLAPKVLGTETLHQKALKSPAKFHPRVGGAARSAPQAEWREKEIVSEYAYASLGGDTQTIHEVRKVVSADGKPVEDARKAQQTLAKIITSNDQERKLQLLKAFEPYGLTGEVTDFGQMILLFHPRSIGRFEFRLEGLEILGKVHTLVFHYNQIDGAGAVTVFDASHKDAARGVRAEGRVWVVEDTYLPVRISMLSTSGELNSVREEATVDYELSRFGVLLPAATLHRETIGGRLVTENHFVYSDFHKFGADSDISFEPAK
jgi:hypothetical protein